MKYFKVWSYFLHLQKSFGTLFMLQMNSFRFTDSIDRTEFLKLAEFDLPKNREDGILCWAKSFVIIRCEKLPAEEILIIKNGLQDYTIITNKTEMPWKLEEVKGYLFLHI